MIINYYNRKQIHKWEGPQKAQLINILRDWSLGKKGIRKEENNTTDAKNDNRENKHS